jgi:hypothetical protein
VKPPGWALATLAGVLAVAAITLAGCSSGVSASQGRAAAVKARSQVLPQVSALYQEIYQARAGWAFAVDASYLRCIRANSTTQVAYHNNISYVRGFQGGTTASFQQRILAIVHASGWKDSLNNGDKPHGNWDAHYDISKGPVKGDLAMAGRIALLRFSSPCFNAGPAATSLGSQGGEVPVPHPSVTSPGG